MAVMNLNNVGCQGASSRQLGAVPDKQPGRRKKRHRPRGVRALLCGLLALLTLLASPAGAETSTYMVTNAQGTVVATMDRDQNVAYTATYRPYGKQQTGAAHAGPGYTGHVNDPDTGLVYMQARYYDPGVGRFLSVDPIGPAAGNPFNFNRYAYANDNPVVNTDPTGADCFRGDHTSCNPDDNPRPPPPPPKPEVSPSVQRMRDTSDCGGCVQPSLVQFHSAEGTDIFHVAGKAIATDIAYAQGAITGNQALMNEAADGFSKDVGTKTAFATLITLGTMGREGAPEATAPVGRLGSPMEIPRGTNGAGRVDGIEYSGHAFDRMQGRGLTPSIVRNTIENGVQSPGRNGAVMHYDGVNNMTVITNASGKVITAYPGGG